MPPQKPSKSSAIPRTQRRLAAAFARIIHRYEGYRKLVGRVDRETYSAGMDWCGSSEGLAIWLCQRAPCLGGAGPLRTMRTAKGRKLVAKSLRALTQGTYV